MKTAGPRVYVGDYIALGYQANGSPAALVGFVQVEYDDGSSELLDIPEQSSFTTNFSLNYVFGRRIPAEGIVTGAWLVSRSSLVRGQFHGFLFIDRGGRQLTLCAGWLYPGHDTVALGEFVEATDPSWPAGATWVFQGTVLEDATAGTHVCSLTVTPGAGNELRILTMRFVAGAGAANITSFFFDDGTNRLGTMVDSLSLASGAITQWPSYQAPVAANSNINGPSDGIFISGAMRLVMNVSTATVSLTHTFAVVCRLLGGLPTATLADTVGAPTLTTNTNRVF